METTSEMTTTTFVQRFARSQIIKIFQQLDEGGLMIDEPDGRLFLGNAQAPMQAQLEVKNMQFYSRVLFGGSIGAGESWVDGDWHSDDLTKVIRVFARSLPIIAKLEKRAAWITKPVNLFRHRRNHNSKSNSRANIAAHYDLGNEMYQLFLDPHMQYSSAIFPNAKASLEEAQQHKMRLICDKLALSPADHLVEIGTGWGGLACFAAKHYGCKVTTTTLSKEQLAIAQQRVKEQGLEGKVTLLLKDYRDMQGQYDKLVSIEMIEAVGDKYLPSYFKTLNRLLKPGGKMLIQAITIADQRYDEYRKSVDFMQRYIFPGGFLPSISELCKQVKRQTDMTVSRIESYGHDYADTLKKWDERFKHHYGDLNKLGYSDDFKRLWAFYFAYCEAGFREGTIGLIQFEAEKPQARICQAA